MTSSVPTCSCSISIRGEGVACDFVIETALKLRRMLQDEGLESWPKLTGGKGFHLMAPLDPTIDHDQARAYVRQIAQRLAATAPDRYTISSAPEKRTVRIFIDYDGRPCIACRLMTAKSSSNQFR